MFWSKVSTLSRLISPHQVNEKHHCIWSAPKPMDGLQRSSSWPVNTNDRKKWNLVLQIWDPRQLVQTIHHTQILRNYIDDLLHPLRFSKTLDAWNKVSWGIWGGHYCWEIINLPNHILTIVHKHMNSNTCLKIFLLLSPDSYYHHGRRQRVRKQESCVSKQWDERKPFTRHLV